MMDSRIKVETAAPCFPHAQSQVRSGDLAIENNRASNKANNLLKRTNTGLLEAAKDLLASQKMGAAMDRITNFFVSSFPDEVTKENVRNLVLNSSEVTCDSGTILTRYGERAKHFVFFMEGEGQVREEGRKRAEDLISLSCSWVPLPTWAISVTEEDERNEQCRLGWNGCSAFSLFSARENVRGEIEGKGGKQKVGRRWSDLRRSLVPPFRVSSAHSPPFPALGQPVSLIAKGEFVGVEGLLGFELNSPSYWFTLITTKPSKLVVVETAKFQTMGPLKLKAKIRQMSVPKYHRRFDELLRREERNVRRREKAGAMQEDFSPPQAKQVLRLLQQSGELQELKDGGRPVVAAPLDPEVDKEAFRRFLLKNQDEFVWHKGLTIAVRPPFDILKDQFLMKPIKHPKLPSQLQKDSFSVPLPTPFKTYSFRTLHAGRPVGVRHKIVNSEGKLTDVRAQIIFQDNPDAVFKKKIKKSSNPNYRQGILRSEGKPIDEYANL